MVQFSGLAPVGIIISSETEVAEEGVVARTEAGRLRGHLWIGRKLSMATQQG